MRLDSFECIEKFRKILDFMGYKTLHSVAKLRQQKELDRFEIGAAKLNDNVNFRQKFDGMKVDIALGDILVLKEISAAAEACLCLSIQTDDACNAVQNQTYERCKKASLCGASFYDLIE